MFKISQIAKDLGLKAKDVTTRLDSVGIPGKGSSGTLENEEFSLFFTDLLGSAIIKDINGYINGTTKIIMPDTPAQAAERE